MVGARIKQNVWGSQISSPTSDAHAILIDMSHHWNHKPEPARSCRCSVYSVSPLRLHGSQLTCRVPPRPYCIHFWDVRVPTMPRVDQDVAQQPAGSAPHRSQGVWSIWIFLFPEAKHCTKVNDWLFENNQKLLEIDLLTEHSKLVCRGSSSKSKLVCGDLEYGFQLGL